MVFRSYPTTHNNRAQLLRDLASLPGEDRLSRRREGLAPFDEALALPSEEAVQVALRTQQIIAEESGVADTVDPLGGSYYVESLTDQLESKIMEYIAEIDKMGGALKAIEIKSSQTIHPDLFRQLAYWQKLTKSRNHSNSFLIYRGEEHQKRDCLTVLPWHRTYDALD